MYLYLFLFFALSIVASFLCSIWEAVILSITPSYAKRQLQEGGLTGQLISEYKTDIDRPLSAILTLNTLAHTLGAIGVGAQAGALFGSKSIDLGFMHLSYESIIAALMTLAILFVSEIIPKTIGANNWKSLAPFTVRSIRVIMFVLYPLVWLSKVLTKQLKNKETGSVLSRADFAAMTQVGKESGAIQNTEYDVINNLMNLGKLTVADIMTPRTVMHIVDENLTVDEYLPRLKNEPFSRIPVFKDKEDFISGLILKSEALLQMAEDKHNTKLANIKRPIQAVSSSLTLPALFEEFVSKKSHLVYVVDDYGSLVGLVSMEDLFETILGIEIMDEHDNVDDLQKMARDKWKTRMSKLGVLGDS